MEQFNALAFPNSTGLKPFGEVQKKSIAHDQAVILGGGRVVKAEPRAFGKTCRARNAALWAVLYGYKRMVPVFSSNVTKSRDQIMAGWKAEIFGNDLLLAMFPDLIWPLRALDNVHQRCEAQTYRGKQTHIRWTSAAIVFPHLPDVAGSGAALVALPLKSCRGATHTTPEGTILRPDLIILDDVQRDEEADNPLSVKKLEDLIDHSALMLGGHSQTMSAIMNCTVRQLDDLSETYLKKPGWRRVRYKMLTSPSKAEKEFWFGDYSKMRLNYDPESAQDQDRAHREALELYKANRAIADEGATVTWDWAYAWSDQNPTEISAIQRAYNIQIDFGESVFASECQNEPLDDQDDLELLTIDEICAKQANYARGIIPADCTTITAFTDVQKDHLFWMICAWTDTFRGYIVDYGAWPQQRRDRFTRSRIAKKLSHVYAGDEGGIMFGALTDLGDKLCGAKYLTQDNRELSMGRWCIDGGWAQRVPGTESYVAQSEYKNVIALTKGFAVKAGERPLSMSPKAKSQRIGPFEWYWRDKKQDGGWITFNTNFWKSRIHAGLSMPVGSRTSISLFKASYETHRMLAEHLRAEKPIKVEAKGATVYEWHLIPGRENEGLDCLVGCALGASMCGIKPASERTEAKIKPRVSFADMAAKARLGK